MDILRNITAGGDDFHMELLCGAKVDVRFSPRDLIGLSTKVDFEVSPSLKLKARMGLYPKITLSALEGAARYFAFPRRSLDVIRHFVFVDSAANPDGGYLRQAGIPEGERFSDYLRNDLFPRSNRAIDISEIKRLKLVGRPVGRDAAVGILADSTGYLWYGSDAMLKREQGSSDTLYLDVSETLLGAGWPVESTTLTRGQADYLLASHSRC